MADAARETGRSGCRPPPRAALAGFTLLEVVVALAVATAVLAAIGLVMGGNARATRTLEERAALIETAREVVAGIPPRDQLENGRLDGAVAGHAWHMEVRPFGVGDVPPGARWIPRHVLVRVRGPGGGLVELETVRLVPAGDGETPPEGLGGAP